MASLYCIGAPTGMGPYQIGLAAEPKAKLEEINAGRDEPLKLLRDRKLDRGWDTLARTILNSEIGYAEGKDGWYNVPGAIAIAACDKAYRATTGAFKDEATDWGAVMSAIRSNTFGCTLEVMGTIAGTATSTVSRWESGELVPGIEEIKRLRGFAALHGLAWRDELIFDSQAQKEAVRDKLSREALIEKNAGNVAKGGTARRRASA